MTHAATPVHHSIPFPTQDEITSLLKKHPLIRLRETVQRAFLVGNFAGGGIGVPHADSDVDILLEVPPVDSMTPEELTEHYRQALRAHFMKNGIRGKLDSAHPQWSGRRVDVYFTYDADSESRPKVRLHRKPEFMSAKDLREIEDVAAEDVLTLASSCVGLKRGSVAARRKLERLAAKRRVGTLRLYGQTQLLEVLATKSMYTAAAKLVFEIERFGVAPGVTKAIDDLATVVRLPDGERAQVFFRCFLDFLRHASLDIAARERLVEAAVAPRSGGAPILAELLEYVEASGATTEFFLKDLELGLMTPNGNALSCPQAQAYLTHARMRMQVREAVGSQVAVAPSACAPRRGREL